MTNTKQNPIICTSGGHTDWTLHSLKSEAELEKLDRQAGHEYVPMDVFIDPRTMKEHFQDSSIRSRWTGIHQAAA
jgi:hypothetical protein